MHVKKTTSTFASAKQAIDLIINGAEESAIREAVRALVLAQSAAVGQAPPDDAGLATAVEQHYRQSNNPWMRFFLSYDPAPALARLRCPVLALNGTLDLQVWHDQNLPVIERAVRDVKIKRYQGLNHLFQPATTGLVGEYGQIETTFDEGVLEDMAEWINTQVQE